MGKRYNPENFVDRVYMDSKFAELRTELITYFDGRLRELQEMINTESEPPAEKNKTAGPVRKQEGEPDPCMIWKMNMNKRGTELAKKYPKQNDSLNTVLRKIYLKMDRKYGVCLAQEVKDCKGGSDKKPSTLEAISRSEKLRNLFESILYNMEDECRLRDEKTQAADAAMLARTRQEIIQPLIEARNDHSIYGSATYSAVGARMRKKGIDFDSVEAAYRGKTGIKRKIKHNELIDNDADLKKKFAETVAEMLHEAGKADHERTS